NPHVSLRQLEREIRISKASIGRMLEVQKFHPFHLSFHQELHSRDFENRVLIEDVLLNVHETMWYQYDGCSAPNVAGIHCSGL
ncbi:hypothetical protein WH47_08446, partial [Habropoda laboriosa]